MPNIRKTVTGLFRLMPRLLDLLSIEKELCGRNKTGIADVRLDTPQNDIHSYLIRKSYLNDSHLLPSDLFYYCQRIEQFKWKVSNQKCLSQLVYLNAEQLRILFLLFVFLQKQKA